MISIIKFYPCRATARFLLNFCHLPDPMVICVSSYGPFNGLTERSHYVYNIPPTLIKVPGPRFVPNVLPSHHSHVSAIASHSLYFKMAIHQVTPPLEPMSPTDGNVRKRVCKACDRCRLKKSKCDGSSPCSRCKADNAICVFGERKKSHDKVYPKG